MESLEYWISHYGYFAIYMLLVLGIVGLPIPDETMLTFAGYLIYKGHLAWFPTFAIALFGSITGITISYIIGRAAGHFLVEKYGYMIRLTHAKIQKIHWWFEKFGRWTLVIGYFIPGVRHFTAIVAGMAGFKVKHFILYAYAGALIWCTTFLSLGYFVGENWNFILSQFEIRSDFFIGSLIIVICIVSAIWYVKHTNTKKKKAKFKKDKHDIAK